MEETGEYLKTPTMLSVTETISGTSVGVYLIIRFSQGEGLEESLSFVIIFIFYCFHCIFGLYVKALLAEGISNEVAFFNAHSYNCQWLKFFWSTGEAIV